MGSLTFLTQYYFKIDGDTDSAPVQREFEKIVRKQIEKLDGSEAQSNSQDIDDDVNLANFGSLYKREESSSHNDQDTVVHDLEDEGMPGTIPTISHHVSMANGHLGGARSGSYKKKQNNYAQSKSGQNGFIPNGRPNFRNMLEESEGHSMDSHI